MEAGSQHRIQTGKHPIFRVVIVSLILHAVLIGLLHTQVRVPNYTPPEKPTSIRARLITIPPPPAPREAEESPVEIVENTPETEIQADATPPSIPQQDQTRSPEPEAPIADPEVEVTAQPTQPAPISSPISEQNRRVISARDLARQHLQQYNQQKNSRIAEQAAEDFQAQKNTTELRAAQIDPFETEDEAIIRRNSIRTNCDDNAVAATMIGFLGGNVRCTKPPPVSEFIKRRLDKTPDDEK